MHSRTKRSSINVIMSGTSSILTLVLNYVTRLIFVRFLNASYLGVNGLFNNILSILSMADLGLTTTMMFSLYKPLAENDNEKIKSLVAFFRKVYLIIAGCVFVMGIALMPFLKYIVNLKESLDGLYVYYFLFLIETSISYLFVYRTTLLSADQKQYLLTLTDMGLSITRFIARILVLIFTKNYLMYIVVGIVLKLLCNICQNVITKKKYPYLNEKSIALDKDSKAKIYSNVKASFLYKFSGTIQNNTDNILISILVGTIVVGYYSNYLLVINGIVGCITLVFSSLKSSVGNFIAEENDANRRTELFNALEVLNFWIICFCSVAFICLFKPFITLSYGSEYTLSTITVVLIVANFYSSNIRQAIWVFRETSGLFVQIKYTTLVTAILNIIFSIIFGYYWGISGIIGATVLARFLYSFWKEPIILYKNIFKAKAKKYFITYFIRLLITAFTILTCYYIISLINIENQILQFFIHCIIVAIIPNIILLLVHIKNKDFKYLIKKLKSLFVNKSDLKKEKAPK